MAGADATPPALTRLDFEARPYCVRWSPDATRIAVGDDDSLIHVVDPSANEVKHVLDPGTSALESSPTLALCWRPASSGRSRGVLVEGNCAGVIRHWHVPSRRCLHSIQQQANEVYCLDYAADGSLFAAAGKDANVRVYEEATKTEWALLRGGSDSTLREGHVTPIFSLRFHDSEPHTLVTGGWDRVLHVWDLRSATPSATFFGPFVTGDCVDMHGHDVLAGSHARADQLRIFDRRRPGADAAVQLSLSSRQDGVEHQCMLYACRFSRDGARSMIGMGGVDSVTGDGRVLVYDRARARFIATRTIPRQSVYSVDFAPPTVAGAAHPRLAFSAGSRAGSHVDTLDLGAEALAGVDPSTGDLVDAALAGNLSVTVDYSSSLSSSR